MKKKYKEPHGIGSLLGGPPPPAIVYKSQKAPKICQHFWKINNSNDMVTILVCQRCEENQIIEKKVVINCTHDACGE